MICLEYSGQTSFHSYLNINYWSADICIIFHPEKQNPYLETYTYQDLSSMFFFIGLTLLSLHVDPWDCFMLKILTCQWIFWLRISLNGTDSHRKDMLLFWTDEKAHKFMASVPLFSLAVGRSPAYLAAP
jgi:hypothetical protein